MEDHVTDKERIDTQMATLYCLRLQVTKSEKETYTKEEILELLDTIAMEKNQ